MNLIVGWFNSCKNSFCHKNKYEIIKQENKYFVSFSKKKAKEKGVRKNQTPFQLQININFPTKHNVPLLQQDSDS